MIGLLASPELFDQRRLLTIGFVRRAFEESCLYTSEEAARKRVYLNCIWLEFADGTIDPAMTELVEAETAERGGFYVIVEGTFDRRLRGHMGRSSAGGLTRIGRLDSWPLQPDD